MYITNAMLFYFYRNNKKKANNSDSDSDDEKADPELKKFNDQISGTCQPLFLAQDYYGHWVHTIQLCMPPFCFFVGIV